jgi:hypothetical protein
MSKLTLKVPNSDKLGERAAGIPAPEIVIYTDENFFGDQYRTNLDIVDCRPSFNDNISSVVVVSGVWEFFRDVNFQGSLGTLSQGYYPSVQAVNIPNDTISSLRVVSWG